MLTACGERTIPLKDCTVSGAITRNIVSPNNTDFQLGWWLPDTFVVNCIALDRGPADTVTAATLQV